MPLCSARLCSLAYLPTLHAHRPPTTHTQPPQACHNWRAEQIQQQFSSVEWMYHLDSPKVTAPWIRHFPLLGEHHEPRESTRSRRERGRWPESFDRLWQSLQERHGKHSGTREMIELLTLGKRYGWDRLQQAVEKALALGCTDAAAVRHLLTATELSRPRTELLELNGLERYERPLPQMNEYDQLLSIAASTAEVAR